MVTSLLPCTSFVPVPANTPQISPDRRRVRSRRKSLPLLCSSSGDVWGVLARRRLKIFRPQRAYGFESRLRHQSITSLVSSTGALEGDPRDSERPTVMCQPLTALFGPSPAPPKSWAAAWLLSG
jgi:hypothetical protein